MGTMNTARALIPKMNEQLNRDRFFGEVVTRWEAGEITLVKITKHLKPEGLQQMVDPVT